MWFQRCTWSHGGCFIGCVWLLIVVVSVHTWCGSGYRMSWTCSRVGSLSILTSCSCKCNRLWAICISPHLMGFGWTPLFDSKGQFFPSLYSWCSAFDPNAHSRINQSKPTCIQTGWRLQVTQKMILNTQCINHICQDEGDPKSVMILTPQT